MKSMVMVANEITASGRKMTAADVKLIYGVLKR